MKKVLKYSIVILAIVLLVTLLTGCGKEESKNDNSNNGTANVPKGNIVVATRESEDDEIGAIEEKIEATFKNDKIDEVKFTYTFDDEETAQYMKEVYDLAKTLSDEDDEFRNAKIEKNGTSVTLFMNAVMLEETEGLDVEDMTMEEFKEELEREGYTIEK